MTTRAFIVAIKPGYAKVRIPIYDGFDPQSSSYIADEDLSWATIVVNPGINISYEPGDVVLVDFQDGDIGRPLVIGHLSSTLVGENILDNNLPEIKANSLEVTGPVVLSKDILIGNISYEDLMQLEEGLPSDLTPISQTDIDSLF